MQKTRLNVRERTKVLEKDAENLQNELQGLKMVLEVGREDRGKALSSGFWKSGKSGPLMNYVKNLSGKDERIIDHVNLENIKFLKYENPKASDIKLPGISKEEKTLKEFVKQSLVPPKKKLSAKTLRCGQCEEKSANVNCVECGEDYCASCFVVFHLKGALKKHRSRPVGAEGLRTPRHDVLLRNVTGPTGEEGPNKVAPGLQQATSAPTLKARTHSSCSTTSCNNNINNSNWSNVSDSSNKVNNKNTSSLMTGKFNEEESALSFQKALRDWRAGNKESGNAKDALMSHRNVRAPPSQEIAVGTVSSPAIESLKLDDLAENLERKIQKTCTLAYSDKLLLKKLRRNEYSTSFIRETKSCLSISSRISEGEEGGTSAPEGSRSDYDVQMAASESNLARIVDEFGRKSDPGGRIGEGRHADASNREIHGDGVGDDNDSSLLIEDLHSQREEMRMFSTRIEPNLRKLSESCFSAGMTKDEVQMEHTLTTPVATEFDHYQESVDRGFNSPKAKEKPGHKVSKSGTTISNDTNTKLNLNLEGTSDLNDDDGGGRRGGVRARQNSDTTSRIDSSRSVASVDSRKESNRSNKQKMTPRSQSRTMSARLASARGKLTKHVPDEISNIASMEDKDGDDAIAFIETSLDAMFMAGVPHGEKSAPTTTLVTDRQGGGQTASTPRGSARSQETLPSERTKDSFKISNQFYQIKQKSWKPNTSQHHHLSEEFDDEAMKSFKEIAEQADDDGSDDNDDDDDEICRDEDDDDDGGNNSQINEEANFMIGKDGFVTSTAMHLSSDGTARRSVKERAEDLDEPKNDSNIGNELKSSGFSTEEEMIMNFFNVSSDERKEANEYDRRSDGARNESDEYFVSKMSARFKNASGLESKMKKTRFSPDVKEISFDDSSPRSRCPEKFAIKTPTQNRHAKEAERNWPAPKPSKSIPAPHKGYPNAPLVVTGRSVTLVSPSESRCLSSSNKLDVACTDKTSGKKMAGDDGQANSGLGLNRRTPIAPTTMSDQSREEDDDDDDENIALGANMARYDDLERLTTDEEELDQFLRLEKACMEGLYAESRQSDILTNDEDVPNSRRSLESTEDDETETGLGGEPAHDKSFNNLDLSLVSSGSSDDDDINEEDIEAVKSLR